MSRTNPYCEALGIPVPSIEAAGKAADANYYSLLIVALLEKGGPLTLEEAAQRFERAGVAPARRALASLKRCKPGRAPIYRDGDLYALDPHDDEVDLWVFRLGLRPPRVPRMRVVRPDPEPLPTADEPLTVAALEEAWRGGISFAWSAQRIAICVLDAHGGVLSAERVLAFLAERDVARRMSTDSARYWCRGAPVRAREDGTWALDREHDAVRAAREAVRERIVVLRRRREGEPDPAVAQAIAKRYEQRREANAERLAAMRRVLVHPFPAGRPEAVVLLDVGRRDVTTYVGDEIAEAVERLAAYDHIAAVDVRAVLRGLGFDPGARRLAELGPPQKTRQLNRRGRTLKITTTLLIQGSCEISRPFGDPSALRRHLAEGKHARFRRRLEADAKSLFALYQYGRTHGFVRMRWGFFDERIPAPWVHRDEPTLYRWKERAHERGVPLEIVVGGAPGWTDPWSRRRLAWVRTEQGGWRRWLVDESGQWVDEPSVQLVRLAEDRVE